MDSTGFWAAIGLGEASGSIREVRMRSQVISGGSWATSFGSTLQWFRRRFHTISGALAVCVAMLASGAFQPCDASQAYHYTGSPFDITFPNRSQYPEFYTCLSGGRIEADLVINSDERNINSNSFKDFSLTISGPGVSINPSPTSCDCHFQILNGVFVSWSFSASIEPNPYLSYSMFINPGGDLYVKSTAMPQDYPLTTVYHTEEGASSKQGVWNRRPLCPAVAAIPERITGFGTCDNTTKGNVLIVNWGKRFGNAPFLVFDSGEVLHVECVGTNANGEELPEGDEYFALFYTASGGNPLDDKKLVGQCPFHRGCNMAAYYHSGDRNNDGQPDCLVKTEWTSKDYGSNDKGEKVINGKLEKDVNPWTGKKEAGDVLDHAVTLFDANTRNVTWLDKKIIYRVGPPVDFVRFCPANSPPPEPGPEGALISIDVVKDDPPLGPETDTFFAGVQERFRTVPNDGPMGEGFAPLCDYNGDGVCDQNDLNILLLDLNKPVSQSHCGAACDLDGDEVITVLDARKFVPLCDRPRCATQ